jgi:hypothetical protein
MIMAAAQMGDASPLYQCVRVPTVQRGCAYEHHCGDSCTAAVALLVCASSKLYLMVCGETGCNCAAQVLESDA